MGDTPDWQTITEWTGDPLYQNPTLTVTPGIVRIVDQQVNQWKGVNLWLISTNRRVQVNLTWYTDSNKGVVIGARQYTTPINLTLQAFERNLGPWLVVELSTSGVNDVVSVAVTPTNIDPPAQVAPYDGRLDTGDAEAVNAGATLTHDLYPYRGPVHLAIQGGNTTGVFELIGLDVAGVRTVTYYRGTAGQFPFDRLLYVAGWHNRLTVINGDGVAKTVWASVKAVL